MESGIQTVKKCTDFHNDKSVKAKILNLNSENKEEINMESMNSKINSQTSQVSLPTSKGVNNSNSPKMGSRRIFTPQFKLQVLESYRNDSDCKGNQRATARKYNIHRRQIQKWLQCESTLRSSVANINQNSVKHQFHNVSLQPTKSSHSSISSPSYTSNQLHSTHLCFDSSRESLLSNTIKMPSLPTCVTSPSTSGTHDIFETSNLAAVVAAATGTITITTSTGTPPTTVVSPLRPSTILSANVNTNSAISPLIQHHYGISPYNNIYPQHHVHQTHPPHQNSYQYHSMPYSPTLSHHRIEKNQSTYFTPISLPDINVLSAAPSNSDCYAAGDTELTTKLGLLPTGTKTYPKFVSDKSIFLCNDNLFHTNYGCSESPGTINSSNINVPFSINHFKGDSTYSTVYPLGPMDLSLHHRREVKPELVTNIKPILQSTADQSQIPLRKEWNDKIDVVDLTYRKRRVQNMSNSCDYENDFSEKYLKLSNPDKVLNESVNDSEISVNLLAKNTSNANEDDDIEIEVGMEEKFAPSTKPVKLFKPYLLDECENKDNYVNSNINNISETEQTEQISTNCFSNGILTKNCSSNDVSERDNTFPDIVKQNNNNYVDNSIFHVESRSESPRSACSPATSVPTMSPTNFQYPKGSPASSGYESSTSSYSDSSLSPRNETYTYGQTYSVKLQMQSIYNDNIKVINSSKHVQRWLEKDDPKPSIALLV